MSIDAPEPPNGQNKEPENVVPFAPDGGGEISEESLRRFNEMMDGFPGDDASEEEVETFMKEVMASDAGGQMIESFSEQLKEGGALDELIDAEEEGDSDTQYQALNSPARMIFKVELMGMKPQTWRRFSLPADASFFDLHCAIQDAMGWQEMHLHRFEFRSAGKIEATFSSGPTDEVDENEYCGIGNRVIDVVMGSEPNFHYIYDFGDWWEHRVTFENLAGAGQEGTSLGLTPMMHDGHGLCPPEDCGGVPGFMELLSGESEFIEEYPAEFLKKLREGEFHPPAVKFRDPLEVLKLWGMA